LRVFIAGFIARRARSGHTFREICIIRKSCARRERLCKEKKGIF
jgi:hypothetical protein